MNNTILYLIIPCYNEEQVLPITAPLFLEKLQTLRGQGLISDDSRIMFVNDGSSDSTWELIKKFAEKDEHFIGISQSRNRGHQNAVLAGLMEAKNLCDITISIDCDGQDDLNAMDEMVRQYHAGNEIVYGVRSSRDTDTFFKRFTAESFYKLLAAMGAEVVYNHADYRLISSRVLQEFASFREVNLFLRGMIPLVGFKSAKVFYERSERMAGSSHYPLKKMLALAFNGITSLSVKPLQMILWLGIVMSLLGFIGIIVSVMLIANAISCGSLVCILSCMGVFSGLIVTSLGIIGEYIGRIYMETKARPRYIISERTYSVKKEP